MLEDKKTITIKTKDYSQTFSNINLESTADDLLVFANAINTLQTLPAEKIYLTTYNLID